MYSHGKGNFKPSELEVDQFYTRLLARLCVIFICFTQIFQRVYFSLAEPNFSTSAKTLYLASVPFLLVVAIIPGIEYILFKKLGTRVLRYSKIVDVIFFMIFTAEWITTLYSAVIKAKPNEMACYSIPAIFGMTSFSWRTLLQTFVTQHWQLKMIPPVAAYTLVITYAVYFDPVETQFTIIRGILQISYIMVLFYFEDKIRWKMMLSNMNQGKWVQINEFILNNIPENILILESGRKPKYISNYFLEFMKSCHVTSNIQDFLRMILNPQKQQDVESSSPSSNHSPFDSSLELLDNTDKFLLQKWRNLEELVIDFEHMISKKGSFSERSFMIYNGKLKIEDQPQKSIEIKISFIQQSGKKYMILILRDTTQRDLLVTLQDNNNYKDHLLASVSHELRAPLNGNINLIEAVIQSKQVPEKIKSTLLTPALRSSKFLLNLINDILDMSQIKAQKLRLLFQSGKIRETLENTIQLIELQAKKKEIELQLFIDEEIEEYFCTDHSRLSQIVLNLLNNAIKFTQKGFVKLRASLTQKTNWVKITVEDSGIGMKQGDLGKLFQNFTHIELKERSSINPTGVGLGLNIASNLVELLGPLEDNKISVISSLDQGSSFSFYLENKEEEVKQEDFADFDWREFANIPSEIVADKESVHVRMSRCSSRSLLKPTGCDSPTSPFKGIRCQCPRILIVDDNPFNTLAFETILDSLDVKHDAVYSGKKSIEKLLKRKEGCGRWCQPYLLIFMDQEMPEMTGSETVKVIRSLQQERKLPEMQIIGCTAHGGFNEVKIFMDSGINKCIHKPISTQIIREILDKVGIIYGGSQKNT